MIEKRDVLRGLAAFANGVPGAVEEEEMFRTGPGIKELLLRVVLVLEPADDGDADVDDAATAAADDDDGLATAAPDDDVAIAAPDDDDEV